MFRNQRDTSMYEAMKAFVTETSLVKFSVIKIQQNFSLANLSAIRDVATSMYFRPAWQY
jgi:hypothetical protein